MLAANVGAPPPSVFTVPPPSPPPQVMASLPPSKFARCSEFGFPYVCDGGSVRHASAPREPAASDATRKSDLHLTSIFSRGRRPGANEFHHRERNFRGACVVPSLPCPPCVAPSESGFAPRR